MKILLLFSFAISAIQARYIQTVEYFSQVNCEVSIDYPQGDLKEPQPLVITDTAEPTFVMPWQRKILLFPSNTSVLLACPGKNNGLKNFASQKYVRASCLAGTKFIVKSEVYEFGDFTCKTLPRESIKKSNSTCMQRHEQYRIGFTIDKYFLPLIELCRDNATYRTYYANTTISKEIQSYQSYPRPFWRYGSYYPGYSMNDIYKVEWQLRSMTELLGSADLARKYIRQGKQPMFLNRGHLAAKADFVYGAQQSATFWHLNTAPQWSTFNSGNWMILERDVRQLAAARHLDLRVYTGVHGTARLRDARGDEQPLYLHANRTHRAIPVPRYYWKVVHEPIGNLATAFVGVNEPHAEAITDDMYLCEDLWQVEGRFEWLTWRPRAIKAGVSYVCAVEELRRAVPGVPELGEIGLLV